MCGSEKAQLIFNAANRHGRHLLGDQKFAIFRCPDCAVTFTDVLANADYYKMYYPQGYYSEIQEGCLLGYFTHLLQKLCFRRRLNVIRKFHPEARRILEIGCGRGEFLHYLPPTFEKYGLEISEEAQRHIRENYRDIILYNEEIETEGFDRQNNPKTYNVIGLWHVFEHLVHPEAVLKKIKNLLSLNGILILEVPNVEGLGFKLFKECWFHLDAPRHLFHYDYKSLENLFKKTGFKIISYSSNPLDYFQDFSFSLLNKLKTSYGFLNILIAFLSILIGAPIRLIVSFFWPKAGEINTFVIKENSND